MDSSWIVYEPRVHPWKCIAARGQGEYRAVDILGQEHLVRSRGLEAAWRYWTPNRRDPDGHILDCAPILALVAR